MDSLTLLLHQLDTAYDRKAWHGPTLKGVLRGVDEALASWRPAPERHTIWELTVHCAYWKYTVHRRITGERRGSFSLEGSNWFTLPDGVADWKNERRLLDDTHRAHRETVAAFALSDLDRKSSTYTLSELIAGAAAHDLYHAGQIQLMKRLAAESRLSPYTG